MSELTEMLGALTGLCRAKKVEDGWMVDADALNNAIELIYKYGDEEQKERLTRKLEEWNDNAREGGTDYVGK